MRVLVFLLLVAVGLVNAEVKTNCDLARRLKAAGMQYTGVSIADWVCLAFHESRYEPRAINHANRDGSKDYGIFQINNKYWCSGGGFNGQGCGVSCTDLFNLQTSIACAKKVVSEQGITAWEGWKSGCRGTDLSEYIRGCGV